MKKYLIIVLFWINIFLLNIGFSVEPIFVKNQFNIPWVYNPVSGFYEQKTKEMIESEIIEKIDFYSDNSLQKFLDDNHWISANYKFNDLVNIKSDFTSNNSKNFMLRKDVAKAFESMARAFSNAFNFKAKLTINSAWRSQWFQRELAWSCSKWRCAKPWTSEHEAWLALDLWVNWWNIKAWSWRYYERLVDNAYKYGFHNSYQKWMEIDGKIVEPWHWRYVWVELATILHEHNQTTEYFYENIEK